MTAFDESRADEVIEKTFDYLEKMLNQSSEEKLKVDSKVKEKSKKDEDFNDKCPAS